MAKNMLNFVQKRSSDANCWVRHRPARPHVGNGLCAECEGIVQREGIQVPARVRAVEPSPATTAAPASAPVEGALAVVEPSEAPAALVGELPSKTSATLRAMMASQQVALAPLKQLAQMIPLDKQETVDDAKTVLDALHTRAKHLRAFLASYTDPLEALIKEYSAIILPTIKEAEGAKTGLQARLSEALRTAQEVQQQALQAIEAASQAGQPLPDGAIVAAQGISLPGQRSVWRWRFAEGKKLEDLIAARPDLVEPNKGMIDGLVRITGKELYERTKGVLEAYEVPITPAATMS